MIYLYLVLKGLFFTWTGWVLGRLRGDGENGAGQSLNISKGWDQFMIGLGVFVIGYPMIGIKALFLIPMQMAMWSFSWQSLRDLGMNTFNDWDMKAPRFILRFLQFVGFDLASEGNSYNYRLLRDYIGWSIRAMMISSIGLAPLYASGLSMYLVPVFVVSMMLFKYVNKEWMKWFSWLPVAVLFLLPMLNDFAWIGFVGLLFPVVELIMQKLELKGIIKGAWGWAGEKWR